MPKVVNFVYCLNVERENDNLNANNILSVLTPEFIPGSFSFALAFSVSHVECVKENTVQILFKNLENDSLIVDSGELTIPSPTIKNDIGLPEEQIGLNMSMDLRNVVFEKEGCYTTQIYFNKELISEKEIYVKGKRNVR